jgi:LacI family transcriptional regulator
MDNVNLKQLAEKLNLSVSTVSKAFRDSYDISPETKQRILSLARQLNYQPNPLASSLRTQKSKTVAVIVPEIANNFFTLAINGIEAIARSQGYHVLIYITHEDHESEVAFTQLLHSGRVDGIIMSIAQNTTDYSHLDNLRERGLPVVFFDRVYDNNMPCVTTNDYESGYMATEHLIKKGCKKIAHLCFSEKLSISQKRKEGYIQALKAHGLPIVKKRIVECDDQSRSYSMIRTLLKNPDRPDGIFSSIEKFAILSYEVCQELRLSIPSDVKIISFSNLETASLLNPSLTTITQPAYEMGKNAATILFESLEKKVKNLDKKDIVIDSVLVPRGSTA